jgi:Ice-binding-like/Bacterial Ig-like domain
MAKSSEYSMCRTWRATLLLSVLLVAACGGGEDPILGGKIAVTAPTVTSSSPNDAATSVPISTSVATVNFSEPLAPISGANFTITCATPCVSPAGTVALDATHEMATFTFAAGATLAPLTLYTATVSGATSLATGLAMKAPFVWTFTTGAIPDLIRPSVTQTNPITTTPGPTLGMATNASIVAVFSEEMAPATINRTTFTLSCTAPCVSPTGSVSYIVGSKSAVFTPATPLAAVTTYTATITAAATDLAGNSLAGNRASPPAASDYIWTFTTGSTADITRPLVTTTVPATTTPGPTPGVATNTAVTAVFTEDMAPQTITVADFTVTCGAPCTSPSGSVSYVVNSKTAVFTPAAALTAATTYTATITTAATDLAGNALAGNPALLPAASAYIWTFTTGAGPEVTAPTVTDTNPIGGASGICINKTINATFSEPMDPSTITTTTFDLAVTGGAAVTGVVAYDAPTQIATFNPVANLTGTPATNYTATIKGGANGVKDLAGNVLAADYRIVFTTGSSTCASAPALGAAAPFGSFGGNATLTNDGLATVINGDVGVNASSTSITGFHDSGGNVYTITTNNNGLVNGLVYTLTAPPGSVAGAAVTQARADALLAFNSISPAALPGGIDVSSLAQCPSCGGAGGGPDELAGRTLPPGVYLSSTGTYDIGGVGRTTANLTLDAGGDANAVWVFQTAAGVGTLTVGLTGPATPAVPIKVLLIGGAQPKNVFWYIPAGGSIGTGSTMVGTMLADASITMSTTGGSPPTAVLTTLNGRAIALTAGVTITNTAINVPAP